MKASIIRIGNSKGVRIPKALLEESGIEKNVNIIATRGEIKIVPAEPDETDMFVDAASAVFAKDWLRPEEEDAWKAYQPGK